MRRRTHTEGCLAGTRGAIERKMGRFFCRSKERRRSFFIPPSTFRHPARLFFRSLFFSSMKLSIALLITTAVAIGEEQRTQGSERGCTRRGAGAGRGARKEMGAAARGVRAGKGRQERETFPARGPGRGCHASRTPPTTRAANKSPSRLLCGRGVWARRHSGGALSRRGGVVGPAETRTSPPILIFSLSLPPSKQPSPSPPPPTRPASSFVAASSRSAASPRPRAPPTCPYWPTSRC